MKGSSSSRLDSGVHRMDGNKKVGFPVSGKDSYNKSELNNQFDYSITKPIITGELIEERWGGKEDSGPYSYSLKKSEGSFPSFRMDNKSRKFIFDSNSGCS